MSGELKSEVVAPTASWSKESTGGWRVTDGTAAVPTPLRVIVCVPAESTSDKVAPSVATRLGMNVNVKLQLAPGGIGTGVTFGLLGMYVKQLLVVIWKSVPGAGETPVIVGKLGKVTAAPPVLSIYTVTASVFELVEATMAPPKLITVGVM